MNMYTHTAGVEVAYVHFSVQIFGRYERIDFISAAIFVGIV